VDETHHRGTEDTQRLNSLRILRVLCASVVNQHRDTLNSN
jgi:hypothetical protein